MKLERIVIGIVAGCFILGCLAGFAQFRAFVAEQDFEDSAFDMTSARIDLDLAKMKRRADALAERIIRASRRIISGWQARDIAQLLQAECDDAVKIEIIMRLIERESAWDPRVIGAAGEVGLMQLLPSSVGVPAEELRDPVRNVSAGVPYLKRLYGEVREIGLALAAYNGGRYSRPVLYALDIMKPGRGD